MIPLDTSFLDEACEVCGEPMSAQPGPNCEEDRPKAETFDKAVIEEQRALLDEMEAELRSLRQNTGDLIQGILRWHEAKLLMTHANWDDEDEGLWRWVYGNEIVTPC